VPRRESCKPACLQRAFSVPSACLQRVPNPQQTLISHCLSALPFVQFHTANLSSILSDTDNMANDGRASPHGIPIRNRRGLERESSLTSQHSQHCGQTSGLPAPQQGRDPTAAATATTTSEGTENTSRSSTSRALGTGVDLDTWLDSTATAVLQMHEGDAGVDGVEQQHDPMFESPDRVDHETDFGGRYSVACTAPCCEGHAHTTIEDSGDNNGDSTPGSSTARPGRSISSAKAEDGPGEGEEEEEPKRAYRAGDGQPSGSANVSGPAASVRAAHRLVMEEITQTAYPGAASRRPLTSSRLDSSDSASSVKKADGPEEGVPEEGAPGEGVAGEGVSESADR
jgi:hypothetical protein